MMSRLRFVSHEVSEGIVLSVIDLTQFSDIREIIDEWFVSICEGRSCSDLQTVKKRVHNLFKTKNIQWVQGAVAEFFVHLYLKMFGLKQECLFLNLEENSIKKGFDGFYSDKNKEAWLMESKSGSMTSKGISHASKVLEAMRVLENKVTGQEAHVNPWRNAYSHASHIDVESSKDIRDTLRELSNAYTNGIYHQIEEFNTIPCGTIYLDGIQLVYSEDKVVKDIQRCKNKLKGSRVHVICVTNRTVRDFISYISS